jgi:hypothetical protein
MKNRWAKLFLGVVLAFLIFLSGALFAVRVAKAGAPESHQYKCVTVRRTELLKADELQATLNANAREGWRLVSASDSVFAYSGASATAYTLLVFEKNKAD